MCLLFTFFQEEISTKFLFLILFIVFIKGFHWLLEGRVDVMERTPVLRPLFHIRTLSFALLLAAVDIFHIANFYWGVDTTNVSSLAVGAEYYILLFDLISIVMRYAIQTYDSVQETHWDQKSLYLLYVDVIVGMLRVFFYTEFAPILWRHHPFPLFIIRPIYLSLRFLKKTIRNLVMSRRAIRLINSAFSEVTAAEIAASNDTVCIICREEMIQTSAAGTTEAPSPNLAPGTIKRLPCGHIFHASCLRNWFQRQQTCPTCRMNILRQGTDEQAAENQRGLRRVPARAAGQQRQRGDQSQARRGGGGSAQIRIDIQRSSGRGSGDNAPQVHQLPFSIFPPNVQFPGVFPSISGTDNQQFFMAPPIVIPGDQFSHLVGGTPMPHVPADLAEGGQESQEALESKLRSGVGARIETLQRIQTLLDASILQMNAYLAATNATPFVIPIQKKNEAGDIQPAAAVSSGELSDMKGVKDASEREYKDTGKGETKADLNEAQHSDELSILRQRRLEKLSSAMKEGSKT
ncbi:unnamed protein product [Rodentolepis nana]|uniref:RING-type E3 ubiquitin transferase n=1 Tax=Rodentolepis nana TaxID=102285 RepID=A0A0R3TLX5_RODNA|nr:unnamed protein product [Rodentolepis nana]